MRVDFICSFDGVDCYYNNFTASGLRRKANSEILNRLMKEKFSSE
jgi:hypothetical protein